MTLQQFKDILGAYRTFCDNCSILDNIGVDLYEGKFPVAVHGEKMFYSFIRAIYNDFGVDWIQWFIYENEYGEKGMEALDGDSLICQDIEGLYNYIEQYKWNTQ